MFVLSRCPREQPKDNNNSNNQEQQEATQTHHHGGSTRAAITSLWQHKAQFKPI